MTTKNFLQKYRPTCFADVVGNKRIIRALINMIKSGRIPNGILFYGPPGSGKTTLSQIFVKALHCQLFSDDICGKCKDCLSFNSDLSGSDEYSYHDCTKITGRQVDEILAGFKGYPMTKLKRHIHIFDEFHRAKEPIQDKFLTALEGTRVTDILLIFCQIELKVTEPFFQRVLALKTSRPEITELVPWLQWICAAEGILVEDDNALIQVGLSADRLPRACLALLQRICLLGEVLRATLVKEMAEDLRGDQV